MDALNPPEVSEADWLDQGAGTAPVTADDEAPTSEETGDEASLRDDDLDARVAADEEARLADAEMRGTGGSYPRTAG